MELNNQFINSVQPLGGKISTTPVSNNGTSAASEFKQALDQAKSGVEMDSKSPVNLPNGPLKIKFSNHAVERMRSRGLTYTPDMLQKIEKSVEQAKAKGAKETLILTDNSALIVSVKNDTIVTVMDRNSLKDNVFTKIDSTVVL